MFAQAILFIGGLFLLLQGANYLVDGSVNVARRFKISKLVIGLTVVALGTSAPEFTVNIIAALRGESELLLSNVSGSNTINILLVLSITALIAQIPVKRKSVIRELPFLLLSGLVFVVMLLGVSGVTNGALHRTEGIILLVLLGAYFIQLFRDGRKVNARAQHETPEGTLTRNILMGLGGLIGLIAGAELMVNSAVYIATVLGVSTTLIGVTVVALGTSLPELASSITAARKKETDLALGNIIGSNIFNTLGVVGLSALITPMPIVSSMANTIDAAVAFGAAVLLTLLLGWHKTRNGQYRITRMEGGMMLGAFVVYLAYILIRG